MAQNDAPEPEQLLTPYRLTLVSLYPAVVLMTPHDYGPMAGRTLHEVVAPISPWQYLSWDNTRPFPAVAATNSATGRAVWCRVLAPSGPPWAQQLRDDDRGLVLAGGIVRRASSRRQSFVGRCGGRLQRLQRG